MIESRKETAELLKKDLYYHDEIYYYYSICIYLLLGGKGGESRRKGISLSDMYVIDCMNRCLVWSTRLVPKLLYRMFFRESGEKEFGGEEVG